MPRRLIAFTLASGAAILTAATALADAAPPWRPGDAVGVPSAAVKDVFIEHEDLTMDLSAVANAHGRTPPTASVVAKYSLRNAGAAKGIDLVFVTASEHVSGVQVLLDGQAVAANLGPLGPVPNNWMPPQGTPAPQGGPDLPYLIDRPAGLTFHVELAPGRHTMATSYQAIPTEYSGDASAYEPVYWQLAFVLSPARQWAGFGDLAVSVRVPAGWPAAVRPSLDRTGNVLTGRFSGVPADSIGITTRMPVPPDPTFPLSIGGIAAVAVLCVITGWFFARPTRWPALLVAAPLLAFVPAVLIFIALQVRQYSIPDGQASWWLARGVFFSQLGQVLLVSIEAVIGGEVGLFIGIGAWAAWRRRLNGGL